MNGTKIEYRTSRKVKRAAIALTFVAIGLLMFFLFPREPSYKDKPLSAWLDLLNESSTAKDINEVRKAVATFGTNALPHLYRNLTYDSGFGKRLLRRALLSVKQISPEQWYNRRFVGPDLLIMPSWYALETMGTNALPIVPKLLENLSNSSTSHSCLLALFAIGPAAIPVVEELCSHPNPFVRQQAANYLAVTAQGKQLFQMKWQTLPSGESTFAFIPFESDGYELIKNLKHTNPVVRSATVEALKLHPNRTGIPRYALEKMAADENPGASKAAKEVFSALYPDAAANTETK